jgi:hypothetical protein
VGAALGFSADILWGLPQSHRSDGEGCGSERQRHARSALAGPASDRLRIEPLRLWESRCPCSKGRPYPVRQHGLPHTSRRNPDLGDDDGTSTPWAVLISLFPLLVLVSTLYAADGSVILYDRLYKNVTGRQHFSLTLF